MAFLRPSSRDDFEVAIICALPIEFDAVTLPFDELWDSNGNTFGKAHNDANTYTSGRIGKHNVVATLLPSMGKAKAAAAASSIGHSYGNLRLVLLTGVCGGVPTYDQKEILLGDVVISKEVIQYDLARKYPDRLAPKDTINDSLRKPVNSVHTLLNVLGTSHGRDILEQRTMYHRARLQSKARDQLRYEYPGPTKDKLFESTYRHKHRLSSKECLCRSCRGRLDPVCKEALVALCEELGCEEKYLEPRKRLAARHQAAGGIRKSVHKEEDEHILEETNSQAHQFAIHIGKIASGDTVMRSADDRDFYARTIGVIAFEMEAAGIWDELPCIVVKGVCDYADCHKSKLWQDFAAISASSASKAILEQFIPSERRSSQSATGGTAGPHLMVPFGRNSAFIGREAVLSQLVARVWPGQTRDDCQRVVIEGLGGVGKTQIALETVYRVRERYPDCSVFWVPAVNESTFQNAYRDIGRMLKITGIEDDKADVLRLVKSALGDESNGNWLLVIDNADDPDLLFGDKHGLLQSLPFNRHGSILLTTRTHEVAVRSAFLESAIVSVVEMDRREALKLLQAGLRTSQISNDQSTQRLLEFLENLPLAIRQASSYMTRTHITTSNYLELCESEQRDMIDLLSRDFDDPHRYKETLNPVATTWLISFRQLSEQNDLSMRFLKFMSLLAGKDIPKFLLPNAGKLETIEAIGSLKAYAFITQRMDEENSFDMHRLVRLAMQNWLKVQEQLDECISSTIERVCQVMPFPEHQNRDMWIRSASHVEALLGMQKHTEPAVSDALLHFLLGEHYCQSGQDRKAEETIRKASELYKRVLGQEHPDTLSSMNNLGLVLGNLGRNKEAEEMHRQTLRLKIKVYGSDNTYILSSMNNLGLSLVSLGRYQEAEEMHRQTLKLYQKVYGKVHLSTIGSMNNLATALKELGRCTEAEGLHRQALEICENVYGLEHPSTISCMDKLAVALKTLGRYREAKVLNRRSLELCNIVHGQEHPSTISSMYNLAIVLGEVGKFQEAAILHSQGLELCKKVHGREHPYTLRCTEALVSALRRTGKGQEAAD